MMRSERYLLAEELKRIQEFKDGLRILIRHKENSESGLRIFDEASKYKSKLIEIAGERNDER